MPCRAESPLLTSYITLGELLSLSEPIKLLLSAEFSTLLVPHYPGRLSVFSPGASVSSPVEWSDSGASPADLRQDEMKGHGVASP